MFSILIFYNFIYTCYFKAEFLTSLLQSHDPSEIILNVVFAAQKTCIIIIIITIVIIIIIMLSRTAE